MECIMKPNNQDMVYTSYQYGNIGVYFKSASGNLDSAYTAFAPGRFGEIAEWTTPYIFDATNKNILIGAGNVYQMPLGGNFNTAKKISNFPNNTNFAAPNQCTAMAQSPKDAKTIFIAKMAHPTLKVSAEVYKTNDYGTTWTSISTGLPTDSYLSFLATDNTKTDVVWATFSNFVEGQKVFSTTDGGKTWVNISYNLPNISANCVTYDDQTGILYVGMDLGVFCLLPNQKTWQPFNTNLPNVIVNDMEINPKTRKLMVATFGRGLWASDVLVITASEPIYQADVQVSPNPAEGFFTIKTKGLKGKVSLKMIDITGRTTYQTETTAEELTEGKMLNVSTQASGMYFLQVIQEDKTKVVKVLLK